MSGCHGYKLWIETVYPLAARLFRVSSGSVQDVLSVMSDELLCRHASNIRDPTVMYVIYNGRGRLWYQACHIGSLSPMGFIFIFIYTKYIDSYISIQWGLFRIIKQGVLPWHCPTLEKGVLYHILYILKLHSHKYIKEIVWRERNIDMSAVFSNVAIFGYTESGKVTFILTHAVGTWQIGCHSLSVRCDHTWSFSSLSYRHIELSSYYLEHEETPVSYL